MIVRVGRLEPFQDGGERGRGARRGIGYWPPRCRSYRQVGAGQNPWKSAPYRFANNKTSSMETLVPNPCASRDPPPSPRPRGISIGGWEESSAMREIERLHHESIYIYIYIQNMSLSISKGSLFAFDELGRGSKNLWKTKLFFNSLI